MVIVRDERVDPLDSLEAIIWAIKSAPKGTTHHNTTNCTHLYTHPHTHIHTRIHHCLMKPRSYGCGQLKIGMDFFRPLGDGDPNTTPSFLQKLQGSPPPPPLPW